MIKTCVIDTETTGTETKNGVHQIAGQVFYDGHEHDKFNFHVSPFSYDCLSEKGVKISGKTIEEIKRYPSPKEVYPKFIKLMNSYVNPFDKFDKMRFVGFNAHFDAKMLRAWMDKCGDTFFGSYFLVPPIDIGALALIEMGEDRFSMPDFKLSTVCDYYGIQPEGRLHDASVDVDITAKLYWEVTDRLLLG